jgi:hypothetical protein
MPVRQPTNASQRRPSTRSDGLLPDPTWLSCLACLIIQTIRRDPTGSDQTDDPSNVSRPDRSGADQIDAEHQATDLAVARPNHVASGRQGEVEQILGVDEVVVAVGAGLRSVTRAGLTEPASNAGHAAV